LKTYGLSLVSTQFDSRQHAALATWQINAQSIMWNDWLAALQAEGKQARGVLWEGPVVDIENRFTPNVEDLKGIVAP
jgi:hypothetical protein